MKSTRLTSTFSGPLSPFTLFHSGFFRYVQTGLNRHQPSSSIYIIGIWHARYSRLTQRATLSIQFGAQACQPGATQADTCPNNQLQTFCKASAICCMMSIASIQNYQRKQFVVYRVGRFFWVSYEFSFTRRCR